VDGQSGACVSLDLLPNKTLEAITSKLADTPEADYVNMIGVSRARAGCQCFEYGMYPYRHERKSLPVEQKTNLGPHDATTEFDKADAAITSVLKHHDLVSFGCDGGLEGGMVVASFHDLSSLMLGGVASRVFCTYAGIVQKWSLAPLLCRTKQGKCITGIIDPPHVRKRQVEQVTSGGRLLIAGKSCVTLGILYTCGVPHDHIVKPDEMSDELTMAVLSAATLLKIASQLPQHLDGLGTALFITIVGNAIDSLQAGTSDVERVACVHLAHGLLAAIRSDALEQPHVVGKAPQYTMHCTPLRNFAYMANGSISLDLQWLEDFPAEPRYPKADGSMRMEHRFGGHRSSLDTPTVLGIPPPPRDGYNSY
jgi:hypothetical protein